jgi:TPR repeat protein
MIAKILAALRNLMGSDSSDVQSWSAEERQVTKAKAEQGDAEAQFDLGIGYATGWVGVRDFSLAAKWLRKSAEQGNPDGQFAFGAHCHKGEGVPKDCQQAALWYRAAAEQGHRVAAFNLGYCFEKGEGVVKNQIEAYAWYSLWAKVDDDAQAVEARAELERSMSTQRLGEARRRAEELRAQLSAKVSNKEA